MKKALLVAALLIVAGIAGTYFHLKQQADKDTAEITQLTQIERSVDELKDLDKYAALEFRDFLAAVQQAGKELEPDDYVLVLKGLLKLEEAKRRLLVVDELMKLDAEAQGEAGELLEKLSTDESQSKELRLVVQKKLAKKRIAGRKGEALAEAAAELLADSRPGVRLAAVEALSEDPTDANKALLKRVAASDTDEDVQMMAEMLLEELEGGGDTEVEDYE